MQTVTQHIRKHLLSRQVAPPSRKLPPMEVLYLSEWHPPFETLMRNRLVMGAYKYGLLAEDNAARYARVQSAIKRLTLYLEDGDGEHLVDAANLAMVEFAQGGHPDGRFGQRGELNRIGVEKIK